MNKPEGVQEPLNINEEYLYGINMRLEILIEMMSSLIKTYAANEGISTEDNVSKQVTKQPIKPTPRKKGTKKDGV